MRIEPLRADIERTSVKDTVTLSSEALVRAAPTPNVADRSTADPSANRLASIQSASELSYGVAREQLTNALVRIAPMLANPEAARLAEGIDGRAIMLERLFGKTKEGVVLPVPPGAQPPKLPRNTSYLTDDDKDVLSELYAQAEALGQHPADVDKVAEALGALRKAELLIKLQHVLEPRLLKMLNELKDKSGVAWRDVGALGAGGDGPKPLPPEREPDPKRVNGRDLLMRRLYALDASHRTPPVQTTYAPEPSTYAYLTQRDRYELSLAYEQANQHRLALEDVDVLALRLGGLRRDAIAGARLGVAGGAELTAEGEVARQRLLAQEPSAPSHDQPASYDIAEARGLVFEFALVLPPPRDPNAWGVIDEQPPAPTMELRVTSAGSAPTDARFRDLLAIYGRK